MIDQWAWQDDARKLAERFPRLTRVNVLTSSGPKLGMIEGTATTAVRVRMAHTGRARWVDPEDILPSAEGE